MTDALVPTKHGATSCPSPWPTPGRPSFSRRRFCELDLDAIDVESSRGFGRD